MRSSLVEEAGGSFQLNASPSVHHKEIASPFISPALHLGVYLSAMVVLTYRLIPCLV